MHLSANQPILRTEKCIYLRIIQYFAQKNHLSTNYPALSTGKRLYTRFAQYRAQESSFTNELPCIPHRKVLLPTINPVFRPWTHINQKSSIIGPRKCIYLRIIQYCVQTGALIHELFIIRHRNEYLSTNYAELCTEKCIYPRITEFCAQVSEFPEELPCIPHRKAHLSSN